MPILSDQHSDDQIMRRLVHDRRPHSSKAALLDSEDGLDYVALSSLTEGYTPADLNDLVDLALQESIVRGALEDRSRPLTPSDFTAALESFTPANLKGVKLQQSEVQWSDIGGEWVCSSIRCV